MAIVTRYVNPHPNNTAGGDGTTSAITGATRAYVSLSAWDAAEQTDLVFDGDSHVVKCVAGVDTTACFVDGWTTGVSNTITIQADAGSEHNGISGNGYMMVTAIRYLAVLEIGEPYVTVQDIECKNTNTQTSSPGIKFTSAASNCVGNRLISQGGTSTSGSHGFYCDRGIELNACVARNSGAFGFFLNKNYTHTLNNCAAIGNNYGLLTSGNSAFDATFNNCYAYGNNVQGWYTSYTNYAGTNNASDDSSEPGTSPVTTDLVDADFYGWAARDGGTLDGAGSATYSPSTDITGTSYASPPAIGPYATVTPVVYATNGIWAPDPRWEMPELLIPGKKPSGQVVINESHPVGKDLVWYWNAKATDWIRVGKTWQRWSSMTGTSTGWSLSGGPSGQGMANADGEADQIVWNTAPSIINGITDSITIFCHFDFIAHAYWGTTALEIARYGSSGTKIGIQTVTGTAGTDRVFKVIAWDTGFTQYDTPTVTIPEGTNNVMIVGTYDGSNLAMFYNGKKIGSVAMTNDLYASGSNDVEINDRWGRTSLSCRWYQGGFLQRALSDADAKAFSADPYSFVLPA